MRNRLPSQIGRYAPILLILLCLPLTLMRAALEGSLWTDETYSVLLTTYPVPEIIELSARDSGPPGYYLLLKVWLRSLRILGLEPGVLAARLLNVGLWLFGSLAMWLVGRRLFGNRTGALLAFAVAASAGAATMARDLRAYGTASVALLLAFLVLLLITKPHRQDDRHRLLAHAPLWLLFVIASTVALWSHLLSAVVLTLLILSWALALAPNRLRLLVEAGAASTAVFVLFTPWLGRVREQISYVSGGYDWMTPPTLKNLLAVFTLWYPFGRNGYAASVSQPKLVLIGVFAALLPLGTASVLLLNRKALDWKARCGLLSLAVATGSVVSFWLLARLGIAATFHGPRYPMLVAAFWITALALLLASAADRRGWSRVVPWVILMPWLFTSAYGQLHAYNQERTWGLAPHLQRIPDLLPPQHHPIFIMPSELLPFYRRTFHDFELRPIEDLPAWSANRSSATVVAVNSWRILDRPRDLVARHLLLSQGLSAAGDSWADRAQNPNYEIFRLDGLQPSSLTSFAKTGFLSKMALEIPSRYSAALPESQAPRDGWSYIEFGPELSTFRWSTAAEPAIRFNKSLPSGRYLLHLRGYREPLPATATEMRLEAPSLSLSTSWSQPPGEFHKTFDLELEDDASPPIVRLNHPLWSPAETQGSSDPRSLGFALYGAWLEPKP